MDCALITKYQDGEIELSHFDIDECNEKYSKGESTTEMFVGVIEDPWGTRDKHYFLANDISNPAFVQPFDSSKYRVAFDEWSDLPIDWAEWNSYDYENQQDLWPGFISSDFKLGRAFWILNRDDELSYANVVGGSLKQVFDLAPFESILAFPQDLLRKPPKILISSLEVLEDFV